MSVRIIKNHYWGIIILVVIMILVGLILFTEQQANTKLNDKEKIVVDALFEKTKPQCIGRYIIDVPINWENGSHDSLFIDDFHIESKFIYPPAFKQRIELREKELREWKQSTENSPALKEVIQLPNSKGVIFDRNQSGSDDAYRILEAHVYINNIAFIITTDILDLSDAKYADEKNRISKCLGLAKQILILDL